MGTSSARLAFCSTNKTVRPNERLQITDKAKSVLHREVLATANAVRLSARLSEVATADAVEEVKHDADYEPDDQPPPSRPWKGGHESECGERARRRDKPDPWRREPARQVRLAHTQHENSY